MRVEVNISDNFHFRVCNFELIQCNILHENCQEVKMQLDSDRKAAALAKTLDCLRMKLIPFIVREVEPQQALLKNFTLDSNWKIGE